MSDRLVEIIDYNGMKLVRIAEPGTMRNTQAVPINSISMREVDAKRLGDELNELFPVEGWPEQFEYIALLKEEKAAMAETLRRCQAEGTRLIEKCRELERRLFEKE